MPPSDSSLDFLAIGDTVVDEFIKLQDATVHCDLNSENCTISMRWGDKIPFESATLLAGVGNSANAAVSAARLGLPTALMATVGNDRDGQDVMTALSAEGLDNRYITRVDDKATNHHFVLWYESERTILVKPEPYEYSFPMDIPAPKTVYLSSLGKTDAKYYEDIAGWLNQHPDTFLAFQPGTFQMQMGTEALAPIYARTDLFVVNKEEAERILKLPADTDEKVLLTGLHALGPKKIIITNDRRDTFISDGANVWTLPMYPDTRPPFERTGAGDAFASTITAAITLGIPFEQAVLWGPINSMAVVQEIGAQKGLLSRAALEEFLKDAPVSYVLTKV